MENEHNKKAFLKLLAIYYKQAIKTMPNYQKNELNKNIVEYLLLNQNPKEIKNFSVISTFNTIVEALDFLYKKPNNGGNK